MTNYTKNAATLNEWLEKLSKQNSMDTPLLKNAIAMADQTNTAKKIPFAESALTQGIAISEILSELKCDQNTLAAAIVYPSYFYQLINAEKITEQLNESVCKLVKGAAKLESLHEFHRNISNPKQQAKQIDNLRKMLLAMVEDIRIVLIKLAENLAILRYLRNSPAIQQQHVAKQTITIYAPLANRLGIGQLKWQLEDLAFRYTQPEEYQKISKALNMRREDREKFIENVINIILDLLKNAHIHKVDVSGRAKHIYSIHRKMQRKHINFSELYDASAVRILVPTLEDCYTILGLVHEKWPPIPQEFDDYIAKPKPNGYRSIHTAVYGPEQHIIEIQIRTHQMHQESELGVAAHWKYKESEKNEASYEDKINWLREVMDWQREISTQENGSASLFNKVFDDRIYVFTPTGDILDLAAGATPLDFAYHIHTDVGNRCKGAKVNGKLVPLTQPLQTGDQVSIITAKENKPSRDWLNPELGYLTTHHAQSKVRQWFNKLDHQEHLVLGAEIWEKSARRAGVHKNDITKIQDQFNFKKVEDLYVAIGSGNLNPASIIQRIKHGTEINPLPIEETLPHVTPPKTTHDSNLAIKGVDNLLTQLARCCKPIPGDKIIGYITKGRGISVHQIHCRNMQYAITYHPERIIDVNWGEDKPREYQVDLMIEAEDHPHLVREITSAISNQHIRILGFNSHVNKSMSTVLIHLTLEIINLDPFHKLLGNLRQIAGISRVERS